MNMTETMDSPAPDCAKTPVPKFLSDLLDVTARGASTRPPPDTWAVTPSSWHSTS